MATGYSDEREQAGVSVSFNKIQLNACGGKPFRDTAPVLIKNGWDVVPIISSQKIPPFKNWQNHQFSEADLSAYSFNGIGILTMNTPAVDNDVTYTKAS